MNMASITNEFEGLSSKHRDAQAKYEKDVQKRKHKYAEKKYNMTQSMNQALQELADNAKPKEAQREKEAEFNRMTHPKLKAIGEEFDKNVKKAESLPTPKERDDAKLKAKSTKGRQSRRATQDARLKLSNPKEVDKISRTPEGEKTSLMFKKQLQKAEEDLENELKQLESDFREELKDIMAKQQELSRLMDAEHFGKVDEDVDEARAMMSNTRGAQQIIERMHAREKPFLDGEQKATSGKGKGRA